MFVVGLGPALDVVPCAVSLSPDEEDDKVRVYILLWRFDVLLLRMRDEGVYRATALRQRYVYTCRQGDLATTWHQVRTYVGRADALSREDAPPTGERRMPLTRSTLTFASMHPRDAASCNGQRPTTADRKISYPLHTVHAQDIKSFILR